MESLINVIIRSMYISITATAIAFGIGISIVTYIVIKLGSRSKSIIIGFFEAMIGIPTTVIGLLIYMLFYPKGPLGFLRILYTPMAIIIGQSIVALPVIISTLYKPIEIAFKDIRELGLSLGASDNQVTLILFFEIIPSLISSFLMGFSRAMGELGVALIVGGGIEGSTNVLTTAIALATAIGEYETAILLGLILLSITFSITVILKLLGMHRWKYY